ncbi:MAG: cell division ATPase MinD [Candidatus Hydrothermarchaeales archaeon]
MGISIAIASGKGGVGKTALAANIGLALAQLGKDVTILDADIEMANLELHFGLEAVEGTLQSVLAGESDLESCIYHGPDGVKLVPAGMSLDGLSRADPDNLKNVLDELMESTEILLIDVPAGLSKSVISSLAVAQQVILVVIPELSSMSDALKTKIVAKKLGTQILGVVINRAGYDVKTDLTSQEVETILEVDVLGIIPEDIEMRRATTFGQPLIRKSPNSPAAIAIKKLAKELVGEKNGQKPTSGGVTRKFLSGVFGK